LNKKYNVAVVGASGAVGKEILKVLDEVDFPIDTLTLLASSSSAGKIVEFQGKQITIQELTNNSFKENSIQIALFSAGGSISQKFAQDAVDAGAVVIDHTSFFRMDNEVPLVVPEVNPQDIKFWNKKGIIANPNCSTIQMVQVLKPLDIEYGIKRVDVSTYQATSGAGNVAMDELTSQMKDYSKNGNLDNCEPKAFVHQIALNVIPQIDSFLPNGYTKEEIKMTNETKKILGNDAINLSSTCVRVPVLRGHSEAITIQFKKDIDLENIKNILQNSENIVIVDDVENSVYPMPILCENKNETFVGRMRVDLFDKNILHLFIVADNLRVGAATNAVRIAQKFITMDT
jgi:aspartate-semialdehyde dehydrogenase